MKCPECRVKIVVETEDENRAASANAGSKDGAFGMNKNRRLVILGTVSTVLTLLFVIVIAVVSGHKANDVPTIKTNNSTSDISAASQKCTLDGLAIPGYELYEEKRLNYDGNAEYSGKILLTGNITKQGVRELLMRLYNRIKDANGWKYHDKPTHIFIFAYTDESRAKSKSNLSIADLTKIGINAEPSINYDDKQFEYLDSKPVDKFGLSQAKRMEIYKSYKQALWIAGEKADEEVPSDPSEALKIGDKFIVRKSKISLLPVCKLDVDSLEALEALANAKNLFIGTEVEVVNVKKSGKETSLKEIWYGIKATTPEGWVLYGWINSVALMNNFTEEQFFNQVQKSREYGVKLENEAMTRVATQYEISTKILEKIFWEGADKEWPTK
jgi:predicted secreted protein